VGQIQIYSRLDQEAHKGLENFRQSIGLTPIPGPDSQRPPRIQQIGRWVDEVCHEKLDKDWDIFVTGTFRPMFRRWRNPKGFAAVETSVQKANPSSRTLHARDFREKLASHSPSEGYVQRYFYEWIQHVSQGLSTRVDFFVGFEAGRNSGANHFHALMAANQLQERLTQEAELFRQYREKQRSVAEFVRNDDLLLWGYLYRTAGRSLILPFDPGRGAGWYIAAAYVGKKQLGWDISIGNESLIPRRPAPGEGRDLTISPGLARSFYHNTLTRWHR
jgi:hypothetical protein